MRVIEQITTGPTKVIKQITMDPSRKLKMVSSGGSGSGVLRPATSERLGGIIVGEDLQITEDGVLSVITVPAYLGAEMLVFSRPLSAEPTSRP